MRQEANLQFPGIMALGVHNRTSVMLKLDTLRLILVTTPKRSLGTGGQCIDSRCSIGSELVSSLTMDLSRRAVMEDAGSGVHVGATLRNLSAIANLSTQAPGVSKRR